MKAKKLLKLLLFLRTFSQTLCIFGVKPSMSNAISGLVFAIIGVPLFGTVQKSYAEGLKSIWRLAATSYIYSTLFHYSTL